MFACVGWQVTLCDPIRQVTLRSCEMDFDKELAHSFTFYSAVIMADPLQEFTQFMQYIQNSANVYEAFEINDITACFIIQL